MEKFTVYQTLMNVTKHGRVTVAVTNNSGLKFKEPNTHEQWDHVFTREIR